MNEPCADEAAKPGAFAASEDLARWSFAGALTFDNAAAVLEAANGLPLPASGVVDLSATEPADSSALAVIFALKRRGNAEGRPLVFEGLPPVLASLARVYGVEELL